MAPPLYFFPGIRRNQLLIDGKLVDAILKPRQLSRTFADVTNVQQDAYVDEPPGAGPGGKSGVFLMAMPTSGEKPARVGYYPNQQEWTEFADGDSGYWVGLDKDQPPTPADIQRKSVFPGYGLTLSGQVWQIPVIRDPHGGTGLPCDWTLEASGNVAETIQREYRSLWEEFASVVDLFFSTDTATPPGLFQLERQDAMARCLQALAVNYRIGRAEQNLLRLVNAETWIPILGATVDVHTFFDLYQSRQQKKIPKPVSDQEHRDESVATSPGQADGSPDTVPAEAK